MSALLPNGDAIALTGMQSFSVHPKSASGSGSITHTFYCLIGKPPARAKEGLRLSLPGVLNFNDVVTGENVFIKEQREPSHTGKGGEFSRG
ncbi:MAG: hypothetical protein M3R39_11435 [Actinomycetota bacterium]|nr:hypothetical protein [Actinomycetota bacterium]